jgi:hypothetical protein
MPLGVASLVPRPLLARTGRLSIRNVRRFLIVCLFFFLIGHCLSLARAIFLASLEKENGPFIFIALSLFRHFQVLKILFVTCVDASQLALLWCCNFLCGPRSRPPSFSLPSCLILTEGPRVLSSHLIHRVLHVLLCFRGLLKSGEQGNKLMNQIAASTLFPRQVFCGFHFSSRKEQKQNGIRRPPRQH